MKAGFLSSDPIPDTNYFTNPYKSVSTRQINRSRRAPGTPVWQRNYHDRIIRNQQELDNIRAYIQTNPQNWASDRLRLAMQSRSCP